MEDIGKCYQKGNKTRFGLKAGGIVSLVMAGLGNFWNAGGKKTGGKIFTQKNEKIHS